MSALSIQFKKKADGSSVLACTRPDGSSTWQRRRGDFFVLHDLTHYAVETVLDLRYGFYGLLAEGWQIPDFGERSIPEHAQYEAALAEAISGLLDQERGTGVVQDDAAFNDALRAVLAQMEHVLKRPLTAEELDAIRGRLLDLTGRWTRLEPGTEMELSFSAASSDEA